MGAAQAEGLAVILDCDGVLLDSISSWYEAEDSLAKAHGIALSEGQKELINTFTLPQAARWFHDDLGIGASPDEVVAFIDDYLLDYYRTRSHALPGALEFVRGLADGGIPRAIVSSSPGRFLHAGLAHAGFAPYAPLVFSADDLGLTKSEPEIYERALAAMGARAERTWAADDSRFALQALAGLGVHTIGVYSRDECATREELQALADVACDSLGEVGADGLVRLAAAARPGA